MLKKLAIVALLVSGQYLVAMESALSEGVKGKHADRIVKQVEHLADRSVRSVGQAGLSQLNEFLSHVKRLVEENLSSLDSDRLVRIQLVAEGKYNEFKNANPRVFTEEYNPNTAWVHLVDKANELLRQINAFTPGR
jgi:hypothetical protein